ncbi:polysaccharide deacetylase family protein [Clostridium perfringens]|uniref:polysaccharide deacetylase family protein n=1 Tax=Clostridium perfringens TaxID=1502 RepID=UPI0018E4438B|nr:polysaccharide deacetylase family protein [Clostridium perfringens]MBI6087816.1 polysaccharide deacetylase family protein [Clostridium perfringens]
MVVPFKKTMALSKEEKVLVLYDKETIFSLDYNILNSVSELLGAYGNKKAETMNIHDYKKDDLNNYNYVMVISIDGNIENMELNKDLNDYKGKIYFIGTGLEKYMHLKKYNLEYIVKNLNIESINYNRDDFKNHDETKKFYISKNIDSVIINPKEIDKVYSYVSDGREQYPNIWVKGNLYHMSLLPDETMNLFMLADSLNDFFQINREGKPKIFVRIEDVHLFRDTNELRKMADYLYGEGIPFIIALIPTYKNLKTGHVTKLSDMPEFVDTIKYMQDRGGSVILHGYDHGGFKGANDDEDFEFGDGENNSPVNWDLSTYIHDNMGDAIKECVKNGIYPLGFEAPHYGMDSKGYKEIKKYFSTYVGQYQSSDDNFTTTSYPYILKNTECFNMLIPENLEYIDPNDEMWFSNFQRNFDILNIVRAPEGGFFYHSFVGMDDLKKVINFLKSKNVEFLNLKDYNNWVKWEGIDIKSSDGVVSTNYSQDSLNKEQRDNVSKGNNKLINNINNILIIVVGGFIIVFIIIFINLKIKGKKKFYR